MKSTIRFSNKLKVVPAILCLLLATGCDDFLDVPTQAAPPNADFWSSEEDATKAVNAIYGNLRGWTNVAFAPIALESLGSDDTEKGSSPSDATFLNTFDDFSATSTQGQILDFWNGRYQDINLCNQVLDNIPAIEMSEQLKNRYLAEAKFVRAYAYFRLVRAFGDVPLRLKVPTEPAEFNIPRTPQEQVWAAIEQDLTDAAAVLPASYSGADIGRVTKGAALALHAKVAMYQSRTNSSRWTDVLSLTEEVMDLGYSLFPDYDAMFRTDNENNSESIFEIQAALIPGNPSASNSQYSQVQGVRGSNGGGWGFNVPTQDLVDEFESDDPRMDATVIFRGETTPQGDAIPVSGDNPMYNQKSYVPFSEYVSGFNEGCQQNIRVIRYADVLLMNAEANNELGNTAAALASLEEVRARARALAVDPLTALPEVTATDKAALRLAIWHERRVELAMEFDRYFDVIRQGRAEEIFGPKGWTANKNEYWPLPQNEIDLSSGTLVQNPGY
jgi:starch-binding outer membrane protein, SusD/RagB family